MLPKYEERRNILTSYKVPIGSIKVLIKVLCPTIGRGGILNGK